MDTLVKEKNYQSIFEEDLIQDVIDFVNALIEAEYTDEEIPTEALETYYVDFYYCQADDVNGNGIEDMIRKSHWRQETFGYIQSGLARIGASKNLKIFRQLIIDIQAVLDELRIADPAAFFRSYAYENEPRIMALLKGFDEQFKNILDEDLIDLSHASLKNLPNLRVLPEDRYYAELDDILASTPDKQERRKQAMREALQNEPGEQKEIRRVCALMQEALLGWNAVDVEEYEGEDLPFFYFTTDRGVRYAVFHQNQTLIFDGDSRELAYETNSPEGFAPWDE
jgi:hypothetical protein